MRLQQLVEPALAAIHLTECFLQLLMILTQWWCRIVGHCSLQNSFSSSILGISCMKRPPWVIPKHLFCSNSSICKGQFVFPWIDGDHGLWNVSEPFSASCTFTILLLRSSEMGFYQVMVDVSRSLLRRADCHLHDTHHSARASFTFQTWTMSAWMTRTSRLHFLFRQIEFVYFFGFNEDQTIFAE